MAIKRTIEKTGEKTFTATYGTKDHKGAPEVRCETTFVDDLEYDETMLEFAIPHAKVVAASKYRNGQLPSLNATFNLSDLLVKAARKNPEEVYKAKVAALEPWQRVVKMFRDGLLPSAEFAEQMLDQQVKDGTTTEDQHATAMEEILAAEE